MVKKIREDYADADPALVKELADVLAIHPVLARLLVHRGIKNFEEARKFFRPDLKSLHDPFLMKDMDRAVTRLEEALLNNEKILVFGDYDVDGTTSVAMMYLFLKKLTENLSYYVPDRYKEGYGISNDSLDFASDNGFSLIIALDCGTRSVEHIAKAKEMGIDFIVCDHHNPGEIIPNAVALLNPKQADCQYPFSFLSGAGVGFKFIQAYCQKHELEEENYLEFLDLVAVSIGADMVPMVGENRVLAHFGLKKLNSNPLPGLKNIIHIAKREGELTMMDVGFGIGPRINAAGRMYSAMHVVELLISTDKELRNSLADDIHLYNEERKKTEKQTTEEALAILKNQEEKTSSIVFSENWHKGVVGIVASRLQDQYYRPTLVLTQADGKITGSARSVKGFNILEAIEECGDLLEQFGGHDHAAGISLLPKNYAAFKARLEKVIDRKITPELLIPKLKVEAHIPLNDIDDRFYRILRQFEPFGPDNETPLFVADNLVDVGECRVVGTEHLRMLLSDNDYPDKKITGVAFKMAKYCSPICEGKIISVCFTLNLNNYKGKTTMQMDIKDIEL
ncbi:MAG: single-stranded-DNA-specific exonuclease RecJ [Bacteroidetes bacterium]|nr:single-stranded-DNA-specific exonuclease RecJ [Bacteroidota bacterium]